MAVIRNWLVVAAPAKQEKEIRKNLKGLGYGA
jgi:hypothetical protein